MQHIILGLLRKPIGIIFHLLLSAWINDSRFSPGPRSLWRDGKWNKRDAAGRRIRHIHASGCWCPQWLYAIGWIDGQFFGIPGSYLILLIEWRHHRDCGLSILVYLRLRMSP